MGSSVKKTPVLAVSMGDGNGIGPEIILKSLHKLLGPDHNNPGGQNLPGFMIFACPETLKFYAEKLEIPIFWKESTGTVAPESGHVHLISVSSSPVEIRPGEITALAGKAAMTAIASAVDCCMDGTADALVTAPISKEAIHLAGYNVPGHTEFLAEHTGSSSVGMMLVNDIMRVGLATIHIPLRDVPSALTPELLEEKLLLFHRYLADSFSIQSPRIAVLGLNPHAGDGGVIGNEEADIISPVIRTLENKGMDITGPWPADGFFASKSYENTDMVLAMYHDQGLIPLKMTGFGGGVNITTGLPIIRTSPDHGTAFSLAGQNQADAGSMEKALHLARELAEKRTSRRKKAL
ncbi:4-hydroxythreonine-4-phosphate dehydrogenase PdxA [Natronogracilivirga saccharolytica]|uniref:4-hydroxythreonine-4-phosphate dehydrogenase n=1 Tax=Natronogracilivirga saccharolytica TaxID=2812953 RepID=A0A8J7UU16_9BACT|nr:4-hydroxythreonine-4-phosphate dehydrogenase PdxA [Natronogracilivirga saccharolytica]MBP3193146.1 4-hydroxythreonine-4-phosphate dehydrogenase PdxA [Natronogracilivirga saccharolytica]